MKIKYHSPFVISPVMKKSILEKMERIEHLNLRHTEIDLFLKIRNGYEASENKELEIRIQVPKQVLFAKAHAESFEKAAIDAIEKIRRQVIKYKHNLEPKRKSSMK